MGTNPHTLESEEAVVSDWRQIIAQVEREVSHHFAKTAEIISPREADINLLTKRLMSHQDAIKHEKDESVVSDWSLIIAQVERELEELEKTTTAIRFQRHREANLLTERLVNYKTMLEYELNKLTMLKSQRVAATHSATNDRDDYSGHTIIEVVSDDTLLSSSKTCLVKKRKNIPPVHHESTTANDEKIHSDTHRVDYNTEDAAAVSQTGSCLVQEKHTTHSTTGDGEEHNSKNLFNTHTTVPSSSSSSSTTSSSSFFSPSSTIAAPHIVQPHHLTAAILPKPDRRRSGFCQSEGCIKNASFNFRGERRGRYCATHKLPDMLNVKPRCEVPECDIIAYFNHREVGKGGGRFCGTHKLSGMVNLHNQCCEYEGCEKQPHYNHRGERGGRFCFPHKLPHMIDVQNKSCEYVGGCDTRAHFNYVGMKGGIFCSIHKMPGMVDVKRKRK